MANRMADSLFEEYRKPPPQNTELPACFSFDPNTLSDEGFKELGLTDKQVIMIRKYIDKGGHFKSKQDFSKMYCINPAEYAHLKGCILLPDSLTNNNYEENNQHIFSNKYYETYNRPTTQQPLPVKVELNTADTLSIRKVKGIGPYFARKIIAYRDRLGGFAHKEQLLEVYRMTPEKLDSIAPFITLDPSLIRKINVNTVSEQDLSQHPYMTRTQCKALMAYRDKHGPFATIKDVTNCLSIDQKTFEKMRIYLDVR